MFDRAQALAKKAGTESDVEAMVKLRGVLADAMRDVRGISTGLSLPELGNLSVEETVRLVIRRHREISHLSVDVAFNDVPSEATDAQKVCIYRFVQECLSNVRKHANATRVSIDVAGSPDRRLKITVVDNGSGFDAGAVHSGLGLTGMKARLHALGGSIEFKSVKGQGTEAVAELSLDAHH